MSFPDETIAPYGEEEESRKQKLRQDETETETTVTPSSCNNIEIETNTNTNTNTKNTKREIQRERQTERIRRNNRAERAKRIRKSLENPRQQQHEYESSATILLPQYCTIVGPKNVVREDGSRFEQHNAEQLDAILDDSMWDDVLYNNEAERAEERAFMKAYLQMSRPSSRQDRPF